MGLFVDSRRNARVGRAYRYGFSRLGRPGSHGADDESTQGRDEGDRDPVQAGRVGGEGQDPRRAVRHDRLAPSHARKALAQVLRPRVVRPRAARPPVYGAEVIAALRFCWAVLGAPTGKRLAAVLPELVAVRRAEHHR